MNGYLLALVLSAAGVLLRMVLAPLVGAGVPFIVLFLPVILCGWYGGLGPGLLATILSAASAVWLFMAPPMSLHLTPAGWWQVAIFVAQGVLVAILGEARQRTRMALGAAQEKFDEILESITDAFAALDSEFRFIYVNSAAEKLLGKSRRELLGKCQWDLFPGLAGTPLEKEYRRAVRERTSIALDNYYEPWDRWFEVRAYPAASGGLAVYFRDITERKRQAEEAQQLAAIVQSSDDAIIGKSLDGIIRSWNEGARKMYGYTAAEAVGQPVAMLAPPERQHEMAEILDRLRVGQRIEHLETVRVRQDGTSFPVSLTVSPVLDREGRVRGASSIARDISERKRLEEKVRETQKLESLGVLAGGVAHDFNNLLTGILGNASMAAEMLPEDDPARAAMLNVIRAGERAADLTRQMLAYSGKGRFVLRPVDLSAQVRDITDLIQSSIPRKVTLDLRLAADLPPVSADPSQMQQLIMNLVINGAEAIGENVGAVTVSTRAEVVDERRIRDEFPLDELNPGLFVALQVDDTGCGMDPDTMARIFDPFFTTKFTGRGLGLAAVSGIVRGHGGVLRVSSTPGKGSSFRVYLPAAAVAGPSKPNPVPVADLRGAGTILVVDDEEMVRRTARAVLDKYGYRVLLAQSGPQAIEIFRRAPDAVSLVLLDLTMPLMGGEETLEALCAIRPDVKAIVSSGYSEAEAVRRFAGRSLAGFLQKPYSPQALAEKVKALLC